MNIENDDLPWPPDDLVRAALQKLARDMSVTEAQLKDLYHGSDAPKLEHGLSLLKALDLDDPETAKDGRLAIDVLQELDWFPTLYANRRAAK